MQTTALRNRSNGAAIMLKQAEEHKARSGLLWENNVQQFFQRADVGMIQCGNRASFAIESLCELCGRHLDRDIPTKARVMGFANLSHSARTNLGKDLVMA